MPPPGQKGDRAFHFRGTGVGLRLGTEVRITPLAVRLPNPALGRRPSSKWTGGVPCDPPLARDIANGDSTRAKCSEVGIFTSAWPYAHTEHDTPRQPRQTHGRMGLLAFGACGCFFGMGVSAHGAMCMFHVHVRF